MSTNSSTSGSAGDFDPHITSGWPIQYSTTTAAAPYIIDIPYIPPVLYYPPIPFTTTVIQWSVKLPSIDKNSKNEFTKRCFVVESKTLVEADKVQGEWAIGVFSFKENRIIPHPMTINDEYFTGYATKDDAMSTLDHTVQPEWETLLESWETI